MARNYAALPYEYLEEMEALNDAEFGRLTRALLTYSMTGEPIALCGNERFYTKRVMAQEDRFKASYDESKHKKSDAGKKGAAKRWDSKNGSAIPAMAGDSKNGYTETNTKTNTDTPPSNDGKSSAPDGRSSDFSVVLASYANRINPMPTETCRAELETFVRELGAEVCLRAIDVAIDERKTSWSYIRGILRAKKEQGVRSLADWDRADEQRQAGKKGKRLEVTQEQKDDRAREDMERARRLLAEMEEQNGKSKP